ncbi:MAG TPA: acyltransferase [Flavisolibacter sp.]|nr:acyltransferase [Flavisolibacter sp.]
MQQRRHFHSFDALRFFAFLKVFLLHIPVMAFPVFNLFREGGGTGVVFFFVLSGFLITYILLEEKKASGTIGRQRFFLRRALRIWPLYFLVVGLAFLSSIVVGHLGLGHSNAGYEPNWFMSFTFLENYRMIATGSHPNVSPLGVTWSLCVEEHFYLAWLFLLYSISLKRIPFLLMGCLLTGIAARFVFAWQDWPTVDLLTNIDYFAFGAMPAYALVRYGRDFERKLSIVPLPLKLFVVCLVLAYVLASPFVNYPGKLHLEPVVFGLGFCLLIMSIIPSKNSVRIGDGNLFSRLGKYTYGLYLYHTLVINLLLRLWSKAGFSLEDPVTAGAFTLLCFAITTGISLISYRFIELPFLRWKERLPMARNKDREELTAFAAPDRS